MSSERTVREVVDLMIDLGLIDPDLPAREPFLAQSLNEPLSFYGDTETTGPLLPTLVTDSSDARALTVVSARGVHQWDRASLCLPTAVMFASRGDAPDRTRCAAERANDASGQRNVTPPSH